MSTPTPDLDSRLTAIESELKRLHSRFDQVENFVAWFRKSNPLGGLVKGVIGGHSKK